MDTRIDEAGAHERRDTGAPPRAAVLAAIEAHLEVTLMEPDAESGLCLSPRVDGPREWHVRWFLPGFLAIAAFVPDGADRPGEIFVRHGGVRVNQAASWAVPTDTVVAIVERFLAGALTVDDADGYRWSQDDPAGPDTSAHRLVRVRAFLRARRLSP